MASIIVPGWYFNTCPVFKKYLGFFIYQYIKAVFSKLAAFNQVVEW